MYKVRVLQEIDDRLDAEYYNPAALSTLKKMETKGTVTTFGNLVDEGYRVVYHGTDSITGLKDSEVLPFLSPTHIDANGSINFEDADKLPLYYKDQYPKGLGKAGEILVEVKGNVSKVGIVPSAFPKNLMISGSLYKATLAPKRVDSHYVLAFLKSQHGQILKNRLTSNTIINYIAKDALYSIPVIEFKEKAQKYIGDKVRQAEQLRTWAKLTVSALQSKFEKLYKSISHYDSYRRICYPIKSEQLFEVLTPASYPPHIEKYFEDNPHVTLGEICSKIYIGKTLASIESSDSFQQATSRSCSGLFLKKPMNMVKREENVVPLAKKDILVTNAAHDKNYIGKDVSFNHSDELILPSAKVLVIRLKECGIPSSYVHAYLMTETGYTQWQAIVRGISAGIHPSDVARIRIPVPENRFLLENMATRADNLYIQSGLAQEVSRLLTIAAKNLVEALIEGQLTERQLIEAQQALEDGDNSLDQAILSKLSAEGYAIEGATPLFSDVDELYSLLEEAAQAEAGE